MNTDIFSLLQPLRAILAALMITAAMSFSYSALAGDVVTDAQITRVAKIAKATGTTITIVKERVTVTVHGGGKRLNIKAKKSATKVMRKRYGHSRLSYAPVEPEPELEQESASSYQPRKPPRLEQDISSSTPPSLDLENAGNSNFY